MTQKKTSPGAGVGEHASRPLAPGEVEEGLLHEAVLSHDAANWDWKDITPRFVIRYWFPPSSPIYTSGHLTTEEMQKHIQNIRRKHGAILEESLW